MNMHTQPDPAEASETGSARPSESATAIRGGTVRVGGYLTGVLVSLASATILVRHLGIVAFGRYVTVVSLLALVGGVTEAGIAVHGIREFTSRAAPARDRLIADLLGMRIALTAVGIAAAAVFGLIVGYREVLVLGTLLAGIALLAQVTADVLSIPLQADLRLGRLTLVDLGRRGAQLLLIALLAAAGAGVLPFLAAPVVPAILGAGILAHLARASIRVRISWSWRGWRAQFGETLPFALAMSIGAVYFYVTVLVMSVIASSTQTGYFATSFRVTQVALAVPSLALTAIFPLIARAADLADRVELGEKLTKVLDVAIVFGVWMSLSMALGARSIIDVIAGHQGGGAVAVLQLQGIVLTASFISAACMFGLLAVHRFRPMLLATAIALPVNVLLGLSLIPVLGARGGAIADVATEIAVASGLAITLARALPRKAIAPSAIAPVVFAALLASSAALAPLAPFLRVGVATVVYFGVLLSLGQVPREITDAARGIGVARMRR